MKAWACAPFVIILVLVLLFGRGRHVNHFPLKTLCFLWIFVWYNERLHRIFWIFFITFPYLEHTNLNKHMWSVGHHKILFPEIQKIVLASNFEDIFGSHISGIGGQNFLWKLFFSEKSNIPKMKKIWVSQCTNVLILLYCYRQWRLLRAYFETLMTLLQN